MKLRVSSQQFFLKKQGQRSRKKHMSKEAIRKIVFKQTIYRVYRRTRKDEDYAIYKEVLNLATTEIIKYKGTFKKNMQVIKKNTVFLCLCKE